MEGRVSLRVRQYSVKSARRARGDAFATRASHEVTFMMIIRNLLDPIIFPIAVLFIDRYPRNRNVGVDPSTVLP